MKLLTQLTAMLTGIGSVALTSIEPRTVLAATLVGATLFMMIKTLIGMAVRREW